MEKYLVIFFAVLSVSFAISYFAVIQKIKEVTKDNLTIIAAYQMLYNQIFINNEKTPNDIHQENFIKFLSDSREWAYQYIEQSQKEIYQIATDLKKGGHRDYAKRLFSLLPENMKK